MDKHLHKTSDKIRAGLHYRICVCFAIYYLDLREFFSYLLQSTHLNVSVFSLYSSSDFFSNFGTHICGVLAQDYQPDLIMSYT